MLQRFRKDPYFLLKYNVLTLTVGLVILAAVLVARGVGPTAEASTPGFAGGIPPWWLLTIAVFVIPEFFVQLAGSALIVVAFAATGGFAGKPWLLALFPLAGLAAFMSGMLMHNTAHRNVRPRWLNRAIGEVCGFHQLGGYAVWSVVHMVHHRYADDPVYDPHPPGTKSFYRYMRTSFSGLITCINRLYREDFIEKDARYRKVWLLTSVVGASSRVTRLVTLLAVLGPAGWACFFVPSYALLTFIYWHFNYVTHRPCADGAMEIRDLDHNAYYRWANRLLGGFYFHRTHHQAPRLFSPYRRRTELGRDDVPRALAGR